MRAARTTHVLAPGNTTDVYVNPLVEQVFLATVEREGLVHLHQADVPRMSPGLDDLTRLGRVEISWSEDGAHGAVLTLADGCVALLAGRRSYCDIVVAGGAPEPVRAAVAELLAARRPGAGTGKTHAVQALARFWEEWCSVHCITDPEVLLRSTPYLMSVRHDPIGDDARSHRVP